MQLFQAFCRLLLLATFLGVCGSPLQAADPPKSTAQSPAHGFPSNTVFFLQLRNGKEFSEKWGRTGMGRMLRDTRLKPLADQLRGSIIKAASVIEEHTGKPLDEIMQLFSGEITFALAPRFKMHFLLTIDFGSQADQAASVISKLESQGEEQGVTTETLQFGDLAAKRIPIDDDRSICYAFTNGKLLFASDPDLFRETYTSIKSEGSEVPSLLVEEGNFLALQRESQTLDGKAPDIMWYADPVGLIRTAMQNNPAVAIGLTFLPFTGLDGIQCIGGGTTIEDGEYESTQRINVVLENPRQGLLKAFAFDPQPLVTPNWAPTEAASFMATRMSPIGVFSGICSTLDNLPGWKQGDAGRLFQRGFTNIEVQFQDELLPLLDGRIYHLTSFVRPISFTSGANVVALGTKDPAKASEILKRVMSKYPDQWEEASHGAIKYYRAKINVPPDFQGPKPPEPALGVLGDEVVFTDRAVIMSTLISASAAPELSLAQNLEYKLIMSRAKTIGHGKNVVALGFSQPQEGMRFWYDMAVSQENRKAIDSQSESNPFFKDVGQALKDHPLPPFEDLRGYFAPGGFFASEDELGLHYFEFNLASKQGAP